MLKNQQLSTYYLLKFVSSPLGKDSPPFSWCADRLFYLVTFQLTGGDVEARYLRPLVFLVFENSDLVQELRARVSVLF